MSRLARLSIIAAIVFGFVIVAPSAALAEGDEPLVPDSPLASPLGDRLYDALEAGATTTEELASAVSLPATGPGSMSFDDAGRVTATVEFDAAPTAEQIALVEQYAVIDRVLRLFPGITVRVPIERIQDVGAIDGVRAVTPTSQPLAGSWANQPPPNTATAPPGGPRGSAMWADSHRSGWAAA